MSLAAQCQKPVSRLWISSLTPDAIRKGFEALRPGSVTIRWQLPHAGAVGPTG